MNLNLKKLVKKIILSKEEVINRLKKSITLINKAEILIISRYLKPKTKMVF